MKPIIEAFYCRAHSPHFLPSPCLCYNPGLRIIYRHGPGARGPICVIDPRVICYKVDDSACFFRFSDSELIITSQNFQGQFCYQRRNWGLLTLSTLAVVASTMFIWDSILTFRMEVDFVWKSKWNFIKGLYLFQCYLPFTQLIWFVLSSQSDVISIFLC